MVVVSNDWRPLTIMVGKLEGLRLQICNCGCELNENSEFQLHLKRCVAPFKTVRFHFNQNDEFQFGA